MSRTAIVTGASRGIGRAIAAHLYSAGYRVIGTATSDASVTETREAFAALRGKDGDGSDDAGSFRAEALRLDDRDSIKHFLDALKDEAQAPTILVNNAGVTRDGLSMRLSDADWDTVLETNVSGAFRLIRGLLRGMMKARFGRIVSMSSVIASMGNAGQVNYAASKGALEAMSRSLARELGSRSITVNVVAPGFIATDMTNALSDEQQALIRDQIALERFGETSEVAELVGFLVSDKAGYITGETIQINGGMYLR